MRRNASPSYLWDGPWFDEWGFWRDIVRDKKASGRNSLERVALARLHAPRNLRYLAQLVQKKFDDMGKPVVAALDSVWIDGTPQAVAKTVNGGEVKCELADLLFLLDERTPSNVRIKRTGVLLQGKIATKHSKLPSSGSTSKERKLLEDVDRLSPVKLYRDTAGTSHIGDYLLPIDSPSNARGLRGYSRYLLMPKARQWTDYMTVSPFQVGWPASRNDPRLLRPSSLADAVVRMAANGHIGREVVDPNKCQWSKMVSDLLAGYTVLPAANVAAGTAAASLPHAHAGHRIHTSGFVAAQGLGILESGDGFGPFHREVDSFSLDGPSPAISIVVATVFGDFRPQDRRID